MKHLFLISTLFTLLFISGCATTVTGRDGNTYEALSKNQIKHLILISRASLADSRKKGMISKNEHYDALHNEPQVKIDYTGDKFGMAKIIWFTRERKLEFTYEDDLTEEIIRKCSFSTSFIPPEHRKIQPDKSIRGH